MISLDVTLSTISIDPRVNVPRQPMRPVFGRGEGFEEKFEPLTLFYDLFWENDGRHAIALGPIVPPHLVPEQDIKFVSTNSGAVLPFDYLPSRGILHGDMYRITVEPTTTSLMVVFGEQAVVRPIQPNLSALFSGRRVLLTRSWNDPLEWIMDWAYYHFKEFGFNTVLFYENNSTAYVAQDVQCALGQVPGIDQVMALNWPYGILPPGTWYWSRMDDSWGDAGIFEHARRRFLSQAELVFNADVDELLYRVDADNPVTKLLDSDELAWCSFASQDIVSTEDLPPRLQRFTDFWWTQGEPGWIRPKCLIVPPRCRDRARWWHHHISDAPGVRADPAKLHLAHFLPLTTGWEGREGRKAKQTPQPGEHNEDLRLKAKLDSIFAGQTFAATPWNPLNSNDPLLMRREAYALLRQEKIREALILVERALVLDPYHPVQEQLRRRLRNIVDQDQPNGTVDTPNSDPLPIDSDAFQNWGQ
jgi:hypothetical protein